MARIPGPHEFIRSDVAMPRLARNLDAPGQAAVELGRQITSFGDAISRANNKLKENRQGAEDDVFLASAGADAQIKFAQRYEELKNQAPVDGDGFLDLVDSDLDSLSQTIVSDLQKSGSKPSQQAITALNTSLINLRGKYGLQAVAFGNNARTAHIKGTALSNYDKWKQFAAQTDGSIDDVIAGVSTTSESLKGMMEAGEIAALDAQHKQEAATSYVSGQITKNPNKARIDLLGGAYDKYLTAEQKTKLMDTAEVRMTSRATEIAGDKVADAAFGMLLPTTEPKQVGLEAPAKTSTEDGAIAFVMAQEGGFVRNDAGAGPTNYGINSRAHPNVDVASLTPDGAAKIYSDAYWKAIDGDGLPEAIRLQAFDAAVNMGQGTAKELIDASGGDPYKFASLRKAKYEAIAQANPSKRKYLKTWLRRTTEALAATDVSTATVGQVRSQSDDPAVAVGTPAPNLSATISRINAEQTDPAIRNAAIDSATRKYNQWRSFNQNQYQTASQMVEEGGSVNTIPVEVARNLTPEQLANLDKRKSQIKTGEPPETNWDKFSSIMSMAETEKGRSALADMNIEEARTELSKKDYEIIKQLQTDVKAGRLDNADFLRLRTVRDEAQAAFLEMTGVGIGKIKISHPKTWGKYQQYEQMLDASIQDLQAQTGKKATHEDVRLLAERLLIKSVEAPWWNPFANDEFAFMVDINDIPSSEREKIVADLSARNVPLNDANIIWAHAQKNK